MKNYYKMYLFLGVCIPVRILLVYIVKEIIPLDKFTYVSIPMFMITFGFILAQLFRKHAYLSSATGGQVWWHKIRPVHIILYLSAGILALLDPKDTWIPLLIDVIFGACMYVLYQMNLLTIKPSHR